MRRAAAAASLVLIIILLAVNVRGEDYIEKYREYAKDGESASVEEFFLGEEKTNENDKYSDKIREFVEALPDEAGDVADIELSEEAASDKFSLSYFKNLIIDAVKKSLGAKFSETASVFALVICAFLIKNFTSSVSDGTSSVLNCVICVCAASVVVSAVESCGEYLHTLSSVSSASIPLSASLLISSGRIGAAGVNTTFIALISALCENVFSSVVLPLISVSSAVVLAEAVNPAIKGFSFSSMIRNAAVWISVAVATVASFVFGIQSVLASSGDTVGMKSAKFALGAFIPYVGGAVGDTASAISAGASSVKSVFGVILLVVLVIVISAPLVDLLIGKLIMSLFSSLSGALGGSLASGILGEISGVFGALAAVVAASGAVFAVIIVTFISYGAVL